MTNLILDKNIIKMQLLAERLKNEIIIGLFYIFIELFICINRKNWWNRNI